MQIYWSGRDDGKISYVAANKNVSVILGIFRRSTPRSYEAH